jgi:hypothetical protein
MFGCGMHIDASTIFNSKLLFVFVYAILLSVLAPGFLLEVPTDRRRLIIKIAVTLTLVVAYL